MNEQYKYVCHTKKKPHNNLPKLTIVTVTRNCELTLEQTILSIINQTYSNIEYIIIDGASTDKTKLILKKFEDFIDFSISEPDKGIYDAMNKGIALATGEWVNFMNAGDEFNDFNVCQLVAEQIMCKNFNVIYGDRIVKDIETNSQIILKSRPLTQIWKGMVFTHQSTFIKLSDSKEILFDLRFKIVADYNQILMLYTKNNIFHYLPIVIARVSTGGVSYSNSKTIIEQIKVVHTYKPYSFKLLFFIFPLILSIIRTILGAKATSKIRKLKWKYIYQKV